MQGVTRARLRVEWRPEAEICEKETEKKCNRDRTGQTGLPAPAVTLCRQQTRVTAPGRVAGGIE